MAFGHRPDPEREGRRLPRVRAAASRDPDDRARQLLQRGRGADHRPDRGAAQRAARARRRCARSRSPSSRRSSSSSSAGPTSCEARQLVQERIAQVTPTLPTWASPPWMMPPLSATSRIMKIGLSSDDAEPDRDVVDRLLEDPPAPAARARAWRSVDIYGERLQQRHVQVDPAKLARARRLARPGHGGDRRRRRRRRAAVHRRASTVGTGGFVETGGAAAEHPQRPADRRARGARRGAGRAARRPDAAPRRHRARRRGPPCRSGARPSSTTAPA